MVNTNAHASNIVGRKQYAISSAGPFIFISGGTDASAEVQSDFLRYSVNSCEFESLKCSGKRLVDYEKRSQKE
jgi:hypothetical protein